jgi:DNA-binding HxlR family transcriptional regulator
MKEPDISLEVCSYSHVLGIISSKWAALVFYALEAGTIRYSEMKKRIEGVSEKMLTQTLRQMERDGLVQHKVTASVPPISEYSLTALGQSLVPYMRMLKEWASDHHDQVAEAQQEYDRKARSLTEERRS